MKITRRQLRNIILKETRADHIAGIKNKIASLEAELIRQEDALEDYRFQSNQMMMHDPDDPYAGRDEMDQAYPVQNNIMNIKRKISFLKSQLAAFYNKETGELKGSSKVTDDFRDRVSLPRPGGRF